MEGHLDAGAFLGKACAGIPFFFFFFGVRAAFGLDTFCLLGVCRLLSLDEGGEGIWPACDSREVRTMGGACKWHLVTGATHKEVGKGGYSWLQGPRQWQ